MDIFSKEIQISGQQLYEKVLSVANHQENANQSHNEMSPHPCQDGYKQR